MRAVRIHVQPPQLMRIQFQPSADSPEGVRWSGGSIGKSTLLVETQKTAVVDPHRAGVDERRHRLQGNKQPARQEAEDAVRRNQAGNIYG